MTKNPFYGDDIIAVLDTSVSGELIDATLINQPISNWFSKLITAGKYTKEGDTETVDLMDLADKVYIQSYLGWTHLQSIERVYHSTPVRWELVGVGSRSYMRYCEDTHLYAWDKERKMGFHGDSKYDSRLFKPSEYTGEEYGRVQYVDSDTDDNGFAIYNFKEDEYAAIHTNTSYHILTKYGQFCLNNIIVPCEFGA
jgi:hypothetical protein